MELYLRVLCIILLCSTPQHVGQLVLHRGISSLYIYESYMSILITQGDLEQIWCFSLQEADIALKWKYNSRDKYFRTMAGVCYGMLGNNLPPPNEAVDLFQRNNIRRIRLYAPNDAVIQALKGTNIELMLDVPNNELQRIASDNLTAAYDWVYYYIVNNRADVKFKYIVVGNEVSMNDWRYVLPAMKNIYSAVQSAGLQDQIKVSTAIYSANLSDSYPPSRSVFRGDLLQYLQPIVGFLVEKRAPLFCNLYPYISYLENPRDIRLDYALFTAPSVLVWDGQYGYQNLFDALLDCVYAALEKVGGSSVEVVVSESGWPNAGDFASTTENGQTYLNKLIQHVKGGTPRRPGRPIETYIFAMFDENAKTGPERERHFGLFTPYKQPKYNINFY